MTRLIQHRRPIANRWRMVDTLSDATALLARGEAVIFPLPAWQAQRARLAAAAPEHAAATGVLLQTSDDPDVLSDHLYRFALIAVRFPSFTDGRGYSIARRLRQVHGWSGALMAVGDVLRDQLLLLERCGFDTFSLREDQDLDASLSAFADFSEHYQATAARAPLLAPRAAPEVVR